MKTNKIQFRTYECGELCPNHIITLELNNRCDYIDIEEQMRLQGWLVFYINDKRVYTICGCGDAVFTNEAKYCNKCIDNNEKGAQSAITHKYGKDKARRK